MVSARVLLSGLLAAASVSAGIIEDPLEMATRLLKRQEPGSPAYNCHNTCGQALRQGRFSGDARCSNNVFTTNYDNCLKCAGPDNVNIWIMYGNSLSNFGRACGLSTTPLSGKQDPVPEAIPAVDPAAAAAPSGGSSSSAAAAPQTTPAATSVRPSSTSSSSPTTPTATSVRPSSTLSSSRTPAATGVRPSSTVSSSPSSSRTSVPVPAGAPDFVPNLAMAVAAYAAVFAAAHMI